MQRAWSKPTDVGWRRFEHDQGRAPASWDFSLWPLLDRLVAGKVREKLGGRLRFAVCGGAPLAEGVAKLFIGLGINIVHGYGLTESSPIMIQRGLTVEEFKSRITDLIEN